MGGFEFDLLSDPDLNVIRAYGLEHQKAFRPTKNPKFKIGGIPFSLAPFVFRSMAIPTTVLIDEMNIIRWIEQMDDYRSRSNGARVLQAVDIAFDGQPKRALVKISDETRNNLPIGRIKTMTDANNTTGGVQDTHPYDGYKLPPLDVLSEFPYEHKFVDVLGSKMAYVDEGEGDPIIFLHGQPTSSYLWRNIIPHLESKGRVIAPDLIGFGKSDAPDINYSYGDHYRYVVGFMDALNLRNVTLVIHDWGSCLGFHYAMDHTDNVKAFATMEALHAPILPATSLDTMPEALGNFFRLSRDPANFEMLAGEDNIWMKEDGILSNFIDRPLAKEALEVYAQPFQTAEARERMIQWPKEMPIGETPSETHDVITRYNAFLEETTLPWLYLYSTPGAMSSPEGAEYWIARAKNIETVYIGNGLHYVQETQPYAIGRAIADWYRRINQKR